MKFHEIAVWGCLHLAGDVGAQVANDSCPSAQDLELILFSPSCYISGAPSQLLIDSTDLAVPNFPYPTNPGTCFGYWAIPNVPANDRWYRFLLPSGDYVEYTCTALDSLQLSWWQGYDCAYLLALDCSTLLPGETIHRLRPGAYHPGTDTLYLQVSSISASSDARFELCYRDTWWGTTPITYGTAIPTPVLCLDHEMTTVSASNPLTADGAVEVNVIAGNGPFSIIWADGATDFQRNSLLTGSYPFTVSDAQNCQLHDTAIVQVLLPTGLAVSATIIDVELTWDDSWLYYTAGGEVTGGRIELMDSMGRLFFMSTVLPGRQRFLPLSEAPNSVFFLAATNADGTRRTVRRYLIPRTH